ncbi:GGDEF domain-containing protein [uncultured Anaerotruncus sp.]|uniref:GGDEF domain-containing protein n=1 Tax=uncultured Anaerotruncus sp. TaxID=905011 RepID=UPI00280BE1E7|nr:GGDEF domain-containing protein [uncultured Anaerotruncus sp.]
MDAILAVVTDIVIILFDLLIYSMMFELKRSTPLYRLAMWGGCAVIVCAYILTTYRLQWPASLASAACMSLPSFLLFFGLSKYKGSRFLMTFCFVDTVSLIIAFIGRYIGITVPNGAEATLGTVLVLCAAVVIVGRPYFKQYHKLLEMADAGWGVMAAANVLIYFALIFFAAYPKPMVERVEYAPTWLVFASVVLACYVVFIQSILKTKRILEQNQRLEQEQQFYKLIYVDALTGLYNRAAYTERINEIERQRSGETLCCVMLDCNRFKQINDDYGHHMGDKALQKVAEALRATFPGDTDLLFRIGGDEFAALLQGCDAEKAQGLLRLLDRELADGSAELQIDLTVSSGYAAAAPGETIENAFIRADRQMYRNKKGFYSEAGDGTANDGRGGEPNPAPDGRHRL